MDEQQKEFSEKLDQLLEGSDVHIHYLYELSDLSDADLAYFHSKWKLTDRERRHLIMRHMADLTESNYEVDFSTVFNLCLKDKSTRVRIAALDGFWDTSDIRYVDPIIERLRDDQSLEVRIAAARALAHYVLIAEWGQIPSHISTTIANVLLEEYSRAEIPLKRTTLEALGAASHPDVAGIVRAAYQSGNAELQLSAIFAMGMSGDRQWMPIILEELSNPAVEFQAEAARAAGEMRSSDAFEDLEELAYSEDTDVRITAIAAVGKIGGDLAHEILHKLANDPDASDVGEAVNDALNEVEWLEGMFDVEMDSGDTSQSGPGEELHLN